MSFTHLPKKERRNIQRQLWKENEKYTSDFVELPIPEIKRKDINSPIKAFRNKKFLVQIFNDRGFTRLSINRTSINDNGDWMDGITWDELFEIKNQIGYADSDMVEVYPAEKDSVNVANIRHLWLTEGLPIVWRSI